MIEVQTRDEISPFRVARSALAPVEALLLSGFFIGGDKMKCDVISFKDYADGRDEGIAALKSAIDRCRAGIHLLSSNKYIRFDTDEPEDIAWSINIPDLVLCSQIENAHQIGNLHRYMESLHE